MKYIDDFLNKTAMYRLVLYVLIALETAAIIFGFLGILPYGGLTMIFSAGFLVAVCLTANKIFARVFNVTANIDSPDITSLILALIITPGLSVAHLMFMFWAGVLAMAGKYIVTYNKRHVFNPAALAVAATAVFAAQSASWWVGTSVMLPLVIIGGLLIVRKIRRADMLISFLVTALATVIIGSLMKAGGQATVIANLKTTLLYTSLFFFGTIMLTEPLTTPPTRGRQIAYGGLVGILFAPQFHLGSFYFTPELALLAGNVFSFLVSPKDHLILKLKEKIQLGPDIFDFVFAPNKKLVFAAGQYLEWTLPVPKADSRGNRRYFTIASSPTEGEIRLGVKFYPEPSRFKDALQSLKPNDQIVASQLAGTFTLPRSKNEKLVMIAGGIGVTPFRSQIKYLIDQGERRDIILLYSVKTASEIVYQDVFKEAENKIGLRTVLVLSDKTKVPENWPGEVGFIDEAMIKKHVPDFRERTFYLSGPAAMVTAFEKLLKTIGTRKIKKDYFPGF
ncbi:MAG TPA: FAD-binding oxidoreductase [Candidatus Saccharimonadales bacterium]|nr:FAD-binding oxidoreductase [Candidatus Saccharimonadales bacterium]